MQDDTGDRGTVDPTPAGRPGIGARASAWAHGAVQPVPWTLAAIAVGFAGVMVAERAATLAPVALPLLLATGLIGALLRDGWGGAGWTWVGGALAEVLGAFAYLAARPGVDAQWDGLVPLFLAGGLMLFAGLFFASFLVTSTLRRLLSRRVADLSIAACAVGLVVVAILVALTGPPAGEPRPAPTTPPSAASRILRA
jgi:hypothetical protein